MPPMVIVPVRTISIPVAVTVSLPMSVSVTGTMTMFVTMAVSMAVSGKRCWRDQQRGSGSRDKEKFANH